MAEIRNIIINLAILNINMGIKIPMNPTLSHEWLNANSPIPKNIKTSVSNVYAM
jgi:hypothetical protein